MVSKGGFTADKTELNSNEHTCTKLTQLQDALLVTRVGATKLIGCSSQVQFGLSAVNKS